MLSENLDQMTLPYFSIYYEGLRMEFCLYQYNLAGIQGTQEIVVFYRSFKSQFINI